MQSNSCAHKSTKSSSESDLTAVPAARKTPLSHVRKISNVAKKHLSVLQVTGKEFIKNLREAMTEMEADAASRDEVLKLANFLISFYTKDKQRTLNASQLSQLIFIFRIESVENTRACFFDLFRTRTQASEVRRVHGGYLIPTEAFVAYLRGRTYIKKSDKSFMFPSASNRGGAGPKQQQVQATDAQNASEPNASVARSAATAGSSSVEAKSATPWLRRHSIMANFLHFLVNMYSRRVPGNLFYSLEKSSQECDFFACIAFLQSKVLKCPMRLNEIYGQIWQNYLRVSQQNKSRVRLQDLQLYCQPIISHSWGALVKRPGIMVGDCIDETNFIRVCNQCML